MTREDVMNNYFLWLYNSVCKNRYSKQISYKKLLGYLHDTEFVYILPRDKNRVEDGLALRYRFAYDYASPALAESFLEGPCSVLEMMVALAIRCEETIMDNPQLGDRTGQWFWGMMNNLGLGSMTDERFNPDYIDDVMTKFMNRDYEPNGKGGLFTVRNCPNDLRTVEIWYQMCWYLDSIV